MVAQLLANSYYTYIIYSFSCLEKIIVVFGERSDLQLGARVSLSPSTFFFAAVE